MHTAFVCAPVLEKLPVKVESIASWGSDMLLIGSGDGHLLVYEVLRRAGGGLDEFDLRVLDSHKGFGRKVWFGLVSFCFFFFLFFFFFFFFVFFFSPNFSLRL